MPLQTAVRSASREAQRDDILGHGRFLFRRITVGNSALKERRCYNADMTSDPPIPGLEADVSRQAVASLDGYAYQIWRSVLEWLTLAADETIELEGNEDIDRLWPGEAQTIPVKNTAGSGSLTLRSPDVVNAINNFWKARQRNAGVRLHMRFLSTSGATHEKKRPFGDRPGLRVWQTVQRRASPTADEEDANSIRAFLVSLSSIDAPLKGWLANASPAELVEQLIAPIHWDLEAEGTDAVQKLIDNQLVLLGDAFHILPSDARKARPRLLQEALARATSKTDRRLGRIDLLRVFEEETTQVVSKSAMALFAGQATITSLTPTNSIFAADLQSLIAAVRRNTLSPPSKHLPRQGEVGAIQGKAGRWGFVYVSGSTGMGKSTLVQLAVTSLPAQPIWLDLRGLKAQVPLLLRHVAHTLLSDRVTKYVVLDDLAFSGDSRPLQAAIAMVVSAVSTLGGAIYATGALELPQAMLLRLGLTQQVVHQAAHLTEQDLDELLALHGCAAGPVRTSWAKLVLIHTRGHPQLAHARVLALRDKGFRTLSPKDVVGVPDEIKEARTQARAIISEIPQSDRELLYRLSLTTLRFRREIAIAAGSHPPPVSEVGDAFQRLVGPWIEEVQADHFRVSPLVQDIGQDVHGMDWATAVHAALSRAFFRKEISAEECSAVLFHAVMGRDERMLVQTCGALMLSRTDMKGLSDWIGWFVFVDHDDTPQALTTSWGSRFLLRSVQFAIAAHGDTQEALRAADRLDKHTRLSQSSDDFERLARVHAISSFITAIDVPLSPKFIVDALIELAQLYGNVPMVRVLGANMPKGIFAGLDGEFDPAWMFAVSIHGRVKTKGDLSSLFEALEPVDALTRTRLLAPLAKDASLAQYLIDAVWLTEWKSSSPDWSGLGESLGSCCRLAANWGANGLASAIATALVRVTNENLNRPLEARSLGEGFIRDLGSDPRLVDVIADTYDWTQQPAEALRLRKGILSKWKPTFVRLLRSRDRSPQSGYLGHKVGRVGHRPRDLARDCRDAARGQEASAHWTAC